MANLFTYRSRKKEIDTANERDRERTIFANTFSLLNFRYFLIKSLRLNYKTFPFHTTFYN